MLFRLRRWLRAAFRREALDHEMSDEMRLHLDRATERLIERGMRPDEARYAARREFGNVGVFEELGRDARGATWVESVRSDLRYAFRALRTSPAFAAVAVLSLAIGVGANTAIFSLINAVMLKALPVERPAELVQVVMRDSASPSALGNTYFTNPIWEHLRDRTADVARYAVSGATGFNLTSGGEVRAATGAWVNGDYFNALGVRPALGRMLASADDYRGCPLIAVASYAFWRSELGGRSDVIGKPITLSSAPFVLVGVASPGFFGVDVGETTQVYAPLCAEGTMRGASSALDGRTNWWIRVLARPQPGVSPGEYNARLASLSRGLFEATVSPTFDPARRASFVAMSLSSRPATNGISEVRTQYAKALLALMGMVTIILVISCANVANLLLARGTARGREIAIRIALGASRARLIRQLVTESALLAGGGAVVGVALAIWGSRLLVGMMAIRGSGQVVLDLSLDLRVLAFTAAVGVATVILFGLAPAWRATRVDPQSAMKAGGRGNIEGHSRFRMGKALVVGQSALALVLVMGAGLLVRSFQELTTMDPGFIRQGILITTVDLRRTSVTAKQYAAVSNTLLDQFRHVAGVRAAAISEITPMGGSSWNDELVVDGYEPRSEIDRVALFNSVSDGYFRTMGTRMIAGRDFGAQDVAGAGEVAIVNRAMMDRFFHGRSPVGKSYQTAYGGKRSPPVTIIGVVENTKYQSMREVPEPIVYVAESQSRSNGRATYLLSVPGSPLSVVGAVKSIAMGIDPRTSLSFTTLSEQIARSLQRERVLATLSGFFGLIALLLAMIGLYGVMAYTVARRRVEIGIRIALGAGRSRVVRLVLGDVGRMIALGIVIGAAGAYAATRILSSFLFGVKPTDPMTLASAAAVLALAAYIAGAIPARRAARLEPTEALRED